MFTELIEGASAEQMLLVEQAHTAQSQGSGNLPVLSTPNMIALMESAAVAAVAPLLPNGYDTVGIRVNIEHLAATVPGVKVTAQAVLRHIEERRLIFDVQAFDPSGLIGKGEHERFIIHAERFMQRAQARSNNA